MVEQSTRSAPASKVPPSPTRAASLLFLESLGRLIDLADIWGRAPSLPDFPTAGIWAEICHEVRQLLTLWAMLGWERRSPEAQPDIPTAHITGIGWAHAILSPAWKRIVSAGKSSAPRQTEGRIVIPPMTVARDLFPPAELEALRAAHTIARSTNESGWVLASQTDVSLALGYKTGKRARFLDELQARGMLIYQILERPIGQKRYRVYMLDPEDHARLVLQARVSDREKNVEEP